MCTPVPRSLLSGAVARADEVCQRPGTRGIIALCPLADRYRPRNNRISHYTPPAETSIHPGRYGFTLTIYGRRRGRRMPVSGPCRQPRAFVPRFFFDEAYLCTQPSGNWTPNVPAFSSDFPRFDNQSRFNSSTCNIESYSWSRHEGRSKLQTVICGIGKFWERAQQFSSVQQL